MFSMSQLFALHTASSASTALICVGKVLVPRMEARGKLEDPVFLCLLPHESVIGDHFFRVPEAKRSRRFLAQVSLRIERLICGQAGIGVLAICGLLLGLRLVCWGCCNCCASFS